MALYKPNSRKGPVFLSPTQGAPPTITAPNGQSFTAVRGDQRGGTYFNEGNYQWVFPNQVLGIQGGQISFNGQTAPLGSGAQRYSSNGGGLEGFAVDNSKPSGFGAPGSSAIPGGFAPGNIGYGSFPAQQQFPIPSTYAFQPITYNPIQTAPYKFTDPQKFAKEFGQFNRGEINKNYNQAKSIAQNTIGQELTALKNYAPAAAALKRNQTGLDNTFNQDQRTSQLDSTLPGVRNQLDQQGQRADAFASGRAPDDVTNQALELGIRSGAADRANAGGFGAQSSVARKASDLMSADERIRLSQYGDQLLSNNISQKANLELAPTEYSNAGSQINVNPPVSVSQLIESNLGNINSATLLSPSTALQTTVGQNQFTTGLEQQTRQFNGANQLQTTEFNSQGQVAADQYNTGTANQFKLGAFDYAVNYAGAVAGAAQTNTNTGLAVSQQSSAMDAYNKALAAAQASGQTGAVTQAISAAAPILAAGFGAVTSAINGSAPSTGNPNAGNGSVGGSTGGGGGGGAPSASVPYPSGSSGGSSGDISGNTTVRGGDPGTGTSGDTGGGGGGDVPVSPEFPSDSSSSESLIGRSAALHNFQNDTGVRVSSGGGGSASGGGGSQLQVPSNFTDITNPSQGVLNAAGVFSQPGTGTQPIGVTNSGQKAYSSVPLLQSNNAQAGSNLVGTMSGTIQPMGALTADEHGRLANLGAASGSPDNLSTLDKHTITGDAKAFVNGALDITGHPSIDQINKKGDPTQVAAAYSAYQLSQHWGSMSPAQKSLGLAALGLQGFRTDSGHTLLNKPVVTPVVHKDGTVSRPGMTVGQGLELLQKGYNAYSLVKNYDQINALQKVSGGSGDATSLAAFAKANDMLGYGPNGASVPNIDKAALQKVNATPTPQYGVGAITLPTSGQPPQGYTVINRASNGIIAIPTPNANSRTPSYLPQSAGVGGVSITSAQIFKNWGPAKSLVGTTGQQASAATSFQAGQKAAQDTKQAEAVGALGGSAIAAGIGKLPQNNPYTYAAMVAANLAQGGTSPENIAKTGAIVGAKAAGYGSYIAPVIAGVNEYGILNSKASSDQKAAATRRNIENTGAAVGSAGLSAVAQTADQAFTGGKGEHIRENLDKFDPIKQFQDRTLSFALDQFGGGKSDAQVARDGIRTTFQKGGLIDNKYQLTLADGSKVDLGADGGSGKHSITNPDLLTPGTDGKKSIGAYELDYTNDLDYAAGMGGITLSRLLNGGRTKQADQLGSQLANASLKSVGFNQQMNEQTYGTTMNNMRSIYAQAGIKSKSDGYQLANQAFSEHRINETDLQVAHQALDLVFDSNSFKTAQGLLDGRHQGIQAASKLPASSTGPQNVQPAQPVTDATNTKSFRPLMAQSKEAARFANSQKYSTKLPVQQIAQGGQVPQAPPTQGVAA